MYPLNQFRGASGRSVSSTSFVETPIDNCARGRNRIRHGKMPPPRVGGHNGESSRNGEPVNMPKTTTRLISVTWKRKTSPAAYACSHARLEVNRTRDKQPSSDCDASAISRQKQCVAESKSESFLRAGA